MKVLKSTRDTKNFSDLCSEVFHLTKGVLITTCHHPAWEFYHTFSIAFIMHMSLCMPYKIHHDRENVTSLKPENFGYKHNTDITQIPWVIGQLSVHALFVSCWLALVGLLWSNVLIFQCSLSWQLEINTKFVFINRYNKETYYYIQVNLSVIIDL